MLRIKTIRGSGAGAARYYSRENEKTPDEYYGREVDSRPTWWTPGETFGVRSGAEAALDEIKLALAGRDPAGSGAALTQAQNRQDGSQRRAAYDLTMLLPSSVSVVYAAADRDTRAALLAETRSAAVEVLAEMQRQGTFTVRSGQGGKAQEGASDVLALVDVHQSNRDGAPFLHVHAVVANFGRRSDGTTVVLNDREMHRAAGTAGALFRAGMAAALERQGLGIERVPGQQGERAPSFRVAGVGPELEKAFTTRKERMVEYVVGKYGAVSKNAKVRASQMQEAAQNTRDSKAKVPTGTALEAHWRATMAREGFTPERVWQQARTAARTVERPRLSAAEAVALRTLRDGGKEPKAATLRLRVAVEAQYRGIGVAGAVAEMARLERDGVQKVGQEAERQQARDGHEGIGQGFGRAALAAAELGRDGLLAVLGGAKDQGDGGGGSDTSAPRRRRRGQEQGQER